MNPVVFERCIRLYRPVFVIPGNDFSSAGRRAGNFTHARLHALAHILLPTGLSQLFLSYQRFEAYSCHPYLPSLHPSLLPVPFCLCPPSSSACVDYFSPPTFSTLAIFSLLAIFHHVIGVKSCPSLSVVATQSQTPMQLLCNACVFQTHRLPFSHRTLH